MKSHDMFRLRWAAFSFFLSFLFFSAVILLFAAFFNPYSRAVETTVRGDETEPAYVPSREEALTVLFIGIQSKNSMPGAYILARFDPVRGTVPVAAIPTLTAIQNNGRAESLGDIYAYGGAEYTKKALENALGIGIDRYVRMDVASFISSADTVGSVIFSLYDDLPVSENGVTATLAGGSQLLDGRKAASIIRAGDTLLEDRYARSSRLCAEIVNQRMDIVLSTLADQVFGKIVNLVDTDISYDDYISRKEAAAQMARAQGSPAVTVELSGRWNEDGTFTLSDTFLARLAGEMG